MNVTSFIVELKIDYNLFVRCILYIYYLLNEKRLKVTFINLKKLLAS